MSPVALAELDPVTRQRVLEQIPDATESTSTLQISNLDISDRAAVIERLKTLHGGAKQAYALRDEQRREAGEILLALRKATPHGDWEPLLKQLCKSIGMSRSTAHNYMNTAEKGSVPKPNSAELEKAKETAQRLQDACIEVGVDVLVSPSRKTIGKFHITYRNKSEAEIQKVIDSAKRGSAPLTSVPVESSSEAITVEPTPITIDLADQPQTQQRTVASRWADICKTTYGVFRYPYGEQADNVLMHILPPRRVTTALLNKISTTTYCVDEKFIWDNLSAQLVLDFLRVNDSYFCRKDETYKEAEKRFLDFVRLPLPDDDNDPTPTPPDTAEATDTASDLTPPEIKNSDELLDWAQKEHNATPATPIAAPTNSTEATPNWTYDPDFLSAEDLQKCLEKGILTGWPTPCARDWKGPCGRSVPNKRASSSPKSPIIGQKKNLSLDLPATALLAIDNGVRRTSPKGVGFWADCEWVPCRDGKWRPVEPGSFPTVTLPNGHVHLNPAHARWLMGLPKEWDDCGVRVKPVKRRSPEQKTRDWAEIMERNHQEQQKEHTEKVNPPGGTTVVTPLTGARAWLEEQKRLKSQERKGEVQWE